MTNDWKDAYGQARYAGYKLGEMFLNLGLTQEQVESKMKEHGILTDAENPNVIDGLWDGVSDFYQAEGICKQTTR